MEATVHGSGTSNDTTVTEKLPSSENNAFPGSQNGDWPLPNSYIMGNCSSSPMVALLYSCASARPSRITTPLVKMPIKLATCNGFTARINKINQHFNQVTVGNKWLVDHFTMNLQVKSNF